MTNSTQRIPLDKAQYDAARASVGTVLVEGGPGTGKSLALNTRAASLLIAGVSPKSIIYLTPNSFRPMGIRKTLSRDVLRLTERVSKEAASAVQVSTIQLLADSWLRRFGPDTVGIPNDFTVWNLTRSTEVVRGLARDGNYQSRIYDEDIPDILRWHTLLRSTTSEADSQGIPALWREVAQLYEREKHHHNALDEVDLVLRAIESMESYPDNLEAWKQRIKPHVLVDDFQNVTPTEYRLLRLFADPNGTFMAAADANQRVGSWRGANGEPLKQFKTVVSGSRHFRLSMDHRFTPALHDFAAGLSRGIGMQPLTSRVEPEKSHPDAHRGENPILWEYSGSLDELDRFTALHIRKARDQGIAWGDIALLCRRHSSIDRLVKAMDAVGIPHTVWGENRRLVSQSDENRMTVSTIHACQGMQWPYVWVVDVSDHIIPGSLGLRDQAWREEEFRLFYIAATRATRKLFFSYCSAGENTPSRFFALVRDVISKEVVE